MNWVPPDQPVEVAIIGAGITGLAAAHRLISRGKQAGGRRLNVTVYEGSDRTGGIIQTVHRDGFLLEMGPDSFITNKPGALDLCREIGFLDQLIPTDQTFRRSMVLRNGRPLPVPEGFMLMAPSSAWSILTTPVLSVRGRLRLLSEAFVRPRRSADDESLASFVARRFGREALDRLVQPLIGGIYTSDPEKLSLQATLPRFPEMERQYGSVIRGTLRQKRTGDRSGESENSGSGARYGLFLTAREGLTQFVDAVTAACQSDDNFHLKLSHPIRSISRKPPPAPALQQLAPGGGQDDHRIVPGWWIHAEGSAEDGFQPGIPKHVQHVIVTLPTHRAANMLVDPDCQELQSELRSVEYASSAIVVSGHHLSDFTHPLDAFGLVIPDCEKRRILAVSFSSRKFPGRAPAGCVLMRTFVGGALQPELLRQSDDQIMELVSEELTSILGMTGRPLFSRLVRYHQAMPQYHVGHLDRVRRIEESCRRLAGLQLAGSAYHGVGIPDSIGSGRAAADRVIEQLTSTGE